MNTFESPRQQNTIEKTSREKEFERFVKKWGTILGFAGIAGIAGGGITAKIWPEIVASDARSKQELIVSFEKKAGIEDAFMARWKYLQIESARAVKEFQQNKKLTDETIGRLNRAWIGVQEIQKQYPDVEKITDTTTSFIGIDPLVFRTTSETRDDMIDIPRFPEYSPDSQEWGPFLYKWNQTANVKRQASLERYQLVLKTKEKFLALRF